MNPLLSLLLIAAPAGAAVMEPRLAPYAAPVSLGMLAYSAPVWMLPGEPEAGCFWDDDKARPECKNAKIRNGLVGAAAGLLIGLAMRDFAA